MEKDTTPAIRNFGDFFSSLSTTRNIDGVMMLEDIRSDISAEDWERVIAEPLTVEMVSRLLDSVRIALRVSLGHFETDEGYSGFRQSGDEFMHEIQDRAKLLGIELETDEAGRPVTLLEGLITSGLAKVITEDVN